MTGEDDVEALRKIPDPIERGQRAGDLLARYQQSAIELARLRREAIELAHEERGLSYTEIASKLGLTKGRISQIRTSAPPRERAFFGIGPVVVVVPERVGVAGRRMAVVAGEDDTAAEQLRDLLSQLHLQSTKVRISPETAEVEGGDVVLVCGPKSAVVASKLMESDPRVRLTNRTGQWKIVDLVAARDYESPMDAPEPSDGDLAYVARHREGARVLVHIAGIHAIGSVGAATFLAQEVADLFEEVGDVSFSMIIGCRFDGIDITSVETVAGPYVW
ncbi:MAG: sigma factor-like helix-turn-helix DNA-binding protein [Acidimicrobiales bacterium]